jgi:uncharacterized protein GlcG (DUF336 family)
MEPLALDEATRILVAARAKATELGLKVSIAVLDPRGDLIALHRLDGALWRTVPIAQGKAAASAAWDKPSGELKDCWHQPVVRALSMMERGRLIPWPGCAAHTACRRDDDRCHRGEWGECGRRRTDRCGGACGPVKAPVRSRRDGSCSPPNRTRPRAAPLIPNGAWPNAS